jgi:hypothetical protein
MLNAMPYATAFHSAITINNNQQVLLCGGQSDSNNTNCTARSQCYTYTPATDSWTNAASMLTSRSEHRMVILNGKRVI